MMGESPNESLCFECGVCFPTSFGVASNGDGVRPSNCSADGVACIVLLLPTVAIGDADHIGGLVADDFRSLMGVNALGLFLFAGRGVDRCGGEDWRSPEDDRLGVRGGSTACRLSILRWRSLTRASQRAMVSRQRRWSSSGCDGDGVSSGLLAVVAALA